MQEVELYHHGIKGQKWGVRRFQNLDGTLTALGRRLANDSRVPKGIRDRAQFALAKRSYQTPRSFTNDYLWNNHTHFPNSEMYKPGQDYMDPRHYKNNSLYKGPEAYMQKRQAQRSNPLDLSWDSISKEAAARIASGKAASSKSSFWEDSMKMHEAIKRADANAAAKSEAYRKNVDEEERRSAAQDVAWAKKQGDPKFFYENGVKKERVSDLEEREIQRGRAIENSQAYRDAEAKYRKAYETDKFHDIDDSSATAKDRGWSFDQYLAKKSERRGAEGEEARSFLDQRGDVKYGRDLDARRTWHNGKMSEREQYRQESLGALDKYNQRKAAADARRQQATQTKTYEQRMFEEFTRPIGAGLKEYPMPSQNAYRSAMSSFSNPSRSPNYQQTVSRVSSAARSTVSSYATKARVNAGKTFTNYLNKMAEAAKNIDADTWSF